MPTVEISKDAETILRLKAYEFHVPESVILDAMIREFSPSSAEAITKQRDMRECEWKRFGNESPDETTETAWFHGHTIGWRDYQTRKPDTFINLIQQYKRETDAPR